MRQIVLDTETTGLEPEQGHRIIEIGCVEMMNRRLTGNNFHQYLQPDREIDEAAVEVHGITNEFLEDKPRFGDVVSDFVEYIRGAELVIHNAPFDVGFINHELRELGGWDVVGDICTVVDTLVMAKKMHPGQRNSLDALCKRYDINNSHRELHGALLDAEILADVYLAMTGGQANLLLGGGLEDGEGGDSAAIRRLDGERLALRVVPAEGPDLEAHEARLDTLDKAVGGKCVWRSSE
ncbi:DNA polymerase III subunit epsilon [Solemya velesiana gill symbiont]|uniref:DNA polymerase III subunit epsilon n=1 Tax=Solemya velesiana gill symbiont TaxID=1918948 RepID=A0A1T2KU51_9GAMM|nr:DNA polymerase III subunit epsilon [Solemya velesiana gill symbiont]OOZ36270.1 DNA polymerase III subunit epsilon [Solemya velesiana gill symbiont]